MADIPTNHEMKAALRQPQRIEPLEDAITQYARAYAIIDDTRGVSRGSQPIDSAFFAHHLEAVVGPRIQEILALDTITYPPVRKHGRHTHRTILDTYAPAAILCCTAIAGGHLFDASVLIATGIGTAIAYAASCETQRAFERQQFMFAFNHDNRELTYGGKARTAPITLALGHELDHALVAERTARIDTDAHCAFFEGHAIGVERQLITDAIAHDDPSRIRKLVNTRLGDLVIEYISTTASLGRTPRESIMRTHATLQMSERWHTHDPSYGLGHALFAIKELEHGPSIYAKALRDPQVILA